MSNKTSGTLLGTGPEILGLFDTLAGVALAHGVTGPTYPTTGNLNTGKIAKTADFNLLANSTRRIRNHAPNLSANIAASSFDPGDKTVTLGTKAEVASWNFFGGTINVNRTTHVVTSGMIPFMDTIVPPSYSSNHSGHNSSYCGG